MTFCAYTILESDVLIVSDTLEDKDRFASCPLATYGGVRFYAGAPLISREGYVLGTLCAMDSMPRGLTPGQIDSVRKLANQVVSLLALRRPRSQLPKPARAEAARHSEKLLQRIVSSAMDAIITVDGDYRVVVFNCAAEQIFGCPASEALGRPIENLVPRKIPPPNFENTFGNLRAAAFPDDPWTHRAHWPGFGKMGRNFPLKRRFRKSKPKGRSCLPSSCETLVPACAWKPNYGKCKKWRP